MIGQRVNRSDPERLFITVRASENNIAKDDCVVWELTAASADGVYVAQPGGDLWAFAGVMDAAVAIGEYGLCQVYGYRSTSRVQTTGTQDTGLPLVPVSGNDFFASVASTAATTATNNTIVQQPIFAVLMESIASTAATATISAKIFIRAL